MKKLLAFALAAVVAAPIFAADEEAEDDSIDNIPPAEAPRKQTGVWPAFFAVSEIPSAPKTPDIVGLRITFPFSTKHESVTGIDVGLWGRAQYFEGFMCSVLRNDVKDFFTGFQVGLYNSVGQADMLGVQIGLWNEAGSIRGVQAGLINVAHQAQGIQFGLVNRAEEMYGFQVGLVNVIRDAELQFCPVLNIGF